MTAVPKLVVKRFWLNRINDVRPYDELAVAVGSWTFPIAAGNNDIENLRGAECPVVDRSFIDNPVKGEPVAVGSLPQASEARTVASNQLGTVMGAIVNFIAPPWILLTPTAFACKEAMQISSVFH